MWFGGAGITKVGRFFPTEDALWFSFYPQRARGVVRYDGKEWRNFTMEDGLAPGGVNSIVQTDDGLLWVVSVDGLSCFDDKTWRNYGAEEGIQFGRRGTYSWPIIHKMSDGRL